MLQWKARFAALLTVLALIAAVGGGGFFNAGGVSDLLRNLGW
jgi:hypothetical protein